MSGGVEGPGVADRPWGKKKAWRKRKKLGSPVEESEAFTNDVNAVSKKKKVDVSGAGGNASENSEKKGNSQAQGRIPRQAGGE